MNYLSESDKTLIQQNLSHLLKDYRSKNGLSSKEMAAKLDYTSARYSKIENELHQWDRLINSFELFYMLAEKIDAEPCTLFVTLMGKEQNLAGKKQLWQEKLVEFFKRIDIQTREDFVDKLGQDHSRDGKTVLETVLKLYVALISKKIPVSVLDSLTHVTQFIAGKYNG